MKSFKNLNRGRGMATIACAALVMAAGSGCASFSGGAAATPLSVKAQKVSTPVVVDGKLDDPAWQTAQAYQLELGEDVTDLCAQPVNKITPVEKGSFQIAYDAKNVYLAVRFEDSDVVAEGDANGLHHYRLGDLVEVFLWPEDQTGYWEIYCTPKSFTTAFFFPGGGRLGLAQHFEDAFAFDAKAVVDGTIDNCQDHDKGWTAEMALPIAELVKNGGAWGAGNRWRLLVARYNYSRWLQKTELTAFPRLPKTNFHLRGCYSVIDFTP